MNTDDTAPQEPTTEAGLELARDLIGTIGLNAAILAIEAQAIEGYVPEWQYNAAVKEGADKVAQARAEPEDYPGRAEFAAGHNPYRCCSFHFAEATR